VRVFGNSHDFSHVETPVGADFRPAP
jgi:hypothetical protein